MKTTLGHFLAYCYSQKSMDDIEKSDQFSNSEKQEIERLRRRSIEVIASGNSNKILNMIPGKACHFEKSFLANNEDFFIALIFDSKNAAEFEHKCLHLFRHLNDCYRCFEIFHHTIRDYYFKSIELSNMRQ
jgi:hypothetical protein